MEHKDHVELLRPGVTPTTGAVWADLGAGSGAFTLALAELLSSDVQLHVVDIDRSALQENRQRMRTRFPDMPAHFHMADFTQPLDLPPLDGIVMANALHFVRNKAPVLEQIKALLKPGAPLLMVEYDADRGNMWVPFPFSYANWEHMAESQGFTGTRRIGSRPSRFLNAIYSAVCFRPASP